MLNVYIQGILSHNFAVPVRGQKLRNDIRKDFDVAPCILQDGFAKCYRVLHHVVQLNVNGHLLTVSQRTQLGGIPEDFLAGIIDIREIREECFDCL